MTAVGLLRGTTGRRSRSATVVVCVLLAILLSGCVPSTSSPDPMQGLSRYGQPLDTPLPASVLSASLVNSAGKPMTLASMKGKIIVVDDTMSLCQETCPLDTAAMVSAARQLDADGMRGKIEFVSLTVDPARDTPVQLAAYRRQFAPAPTNWTTLTGSPAVVQGVLEALGVYWRKVGEAGANVTNWRTGARLTYDIEHSDELYVVDGTGRERFLLDGPPYVHDPSTIPKGLLAFIDAQGRKNLKDPDPSSWTTAQLVTILKTLLKAGN